VASSRILFLLQGKNKPAYQRHACFASITITVASILHTWNDGISAVACGNSSTWRGRYLPRGVTVIVILQYGSDGSVRKYGSTGVVRVTILGFQSVYSRLRSTPRLSLPSPSHQIRIHIYIAVGATVVHLQHGTHAQHRPTSPDPNPEQAWRRGSDLVGLRDRRSTGLVGKRVELSLSKTVMRTK